MNISERFHFDHSAAAVCALDDGPLSGLRHRTVIDARSGSSSLALWQEEHLPGFCVPLHSHDCEEIITILEGSIEAFTEEARTTVAPGQSILIPAGVPHGFRVTSATPVCLLAIFSSAQPKIFLGDGTETSPPWEGGGSAHLDDAVQ